MRRTSPAWPTSRPHWPPLPPEDPMFEHIPPFAGDPILSLNEDFQKDPRPNKINLSIGIYFDDAGHIPVMDAVRVPPSAPITSGVKSLKIWQSPWFCGFGAWPEIIAM